MTNIILPILVALGKEVITETTATVKASNTEATKVSGQDASASTAAATYQAVEDNPNSTKQEKIDAETTLLGGG